MTFSLKEFHTSTMRPASAPTLWYGRTMHDGNQVICI